MSDRSHSQVPGRLSFHRAPKAALEIDTISAS